MNQQIKKGKKIVTFGASDSAREMSKYDGIHSIVFVKKECFEKVGLFDENLSASEDVDLLLTKLT